MSAACAAGGFTGAASAGRLAPASDAPAVRPPEVGRAPRDPATRRAAPLAMGAGRGARSWRWPWSSGSLCVALFGPPPSALPPPRLDGRPVPSPTCRSPRPVATRTVARHRRIETPRPDPRRRRMRAAPSPSVSPPPTVTARRVRSRSPASFACWWCPNRGSASTARPWGSCRAASCRWLPGPTPCASSTPTTSRCSAG